MTLIHFPNDAQYVNDIVRFHRVDASNVISGLLPMEKAFLNAWMNATRSTSNEVTFEQCVTYALTEVGKTKPFFSLKNEVVRAVVELDPIDQDLITMVYAELAAFCALGSPDVLREDHFELILELIDVYAEFLSAHEGNEATSVMATVVKDALMFLCVYAAKYPTFSRTFEECIADIIVTHGTSIINFND